MSTKSAILSAAWDAFEEGGESGLSLRDVANRVGITPMAIYRHFANKQALVDALSEDAINRWHELVQAIEPSTPAEWFRRIGDTYLDFALQEPRRYEAAFLLSYSTALRYPDELGTRESSATTLQMKLLRQMMPRGSAQSSPAEVMLVIVALAQGLISLYRAGRIAGSEKKFRALFRRAMDRCVRSLLESGR